MWNFTAKWCRRIRSGVLGRMWFEGRSHPTYPNLLWPLFLQIMIIYFFHFKKDGTSWLVYPWNHYFWSFDKLLTIIGDKITSYSVFWLKISIKAQDLADVRTRSSDCHLADPLLAFSGCFIFSCCCADRRLGWAAGGKAFYGNGGDSGGIRQQSINSIVSKFEWH